ncbi:MAG: anhydro-N-acetylmuramic acid kinase [Bacteroidia bacterium]
MKQKYIGVGVMTGTSLDAIDIVVCEFEEIANEKYEWKVLAADAIPVTKEWKTRLQKLPTQNAEIYAKTHVYFAHYLGQNLQTFLAKQPFTPDFVAVHGQTIFHQPEANFTAQIGDGETLVTYLNCPLVCNFRTKDVALGGQGAPLVPIGEKFLFADYQLFLNLGGFANLTYQTKAFDVAPCNHVMNSLAKMHDNTLEYDANGDIARSGEIHQGLLEELNALPYFKTAPPKSLGWEWVGENVYPLLTKYNLEAKDALATYLEHISFQLARAIGKVGARNQTLLITGGGKHNTYLIEKVQKLLLPYEVEIAQDADKQWVDFKEAIVFAFLGLRTLTNLPTTLIEVTGAKIPSVTGQIHLPSKGWKRLI